MASSNKQSLVPEAREALNRFKMEAASEVGVNLKQGYNGDLTSRQAGSVGGQMVNIICPGVRFDFIRKNRNTQGHQQTITYNVTVGI
ncbi:MAG: alpha/beta-type small acid-soluble spore protein [Clostridia bacterium]|nr:alpha/beta-type small acid-soluble spore protein [Clostridia bacterium]